jgi:predicted DNA-binding protein
MAANLSVKLDPDLRMRLKRLAEAKDRSAHWLMQQAIHKYVDAEERYEREKAEDRSSSSLRRSRRHRLDRGAAAVVFGFAVLSQRRYHRTGLRDQETDLVGMWLAPPV